MDRTYNFITLTSKYLYFKKAQNSQFCIKTATMFIKKTFKDSKKFKRIRN